MNNELLQEVRKLTLDLEFNDVEKAEKLLEAYLHQHQYDTETWLRLALLEFRLPLADTERSILCINKILAYDPHNIDALLFLSYVNFITAGDIGDELFHTLSTITVLDREYQSMIEYMKAWNYYDAENSAYENLLLKSIQACDKHVYNHYRLASYYKRQGEANKCKELARSALSNVTLVYADETIIDWTDLPEFFNEYIKGIHLTEPNFESIQELAEL